MPYAPLRARALVDLARFEALMLLRRRTVWVLAALLALTVVLGLARSPQHGAVAAASWATMIMYLVPVGVGVLVSDRLVRDRTESLADLLGSLPVRPRLRGLAAAVGSLAGPYLLVSGVFLVVMVGHALTRGDVASLPTALMLCVTVVLPGLLVVSGVAWLLALALPLPAAQIGVIGFWFWACLLNPRVVPVPSPTGTLLSPLGEYATMAAGGEASYFPLGLRVLSPAVTPWTGVLSMSCLLLFSVLTVGSALLLLDRSGARAVDAE